MGTAELLNSDRTDPGLSYALENPEHRLVFISELIIGRFVAPRLAVRRFLPHDVPFTGVVAREPWFPVLPVGVTSSLHVPVPGPRVRRSDSFFPDFSTHHHGVCGFYTACGWPHNAPLHPLRVVGLRVLVGHPARACPCS